MTISIDFPHRKSFEESTYSIHSGLHLMATKLLETVFKQEWDRLDNQFDVSFKTDKMLTSTGLHSVHRLLFLVGEASNALSLEDRLAVFVHSENQRADLSVSSTDTLSRSSNAPRSVAHRRHNLACLPEIRRELRVHGVGSEVEHRTVPAGVEHGVVVGDVDLLESLGLRKLRLGDGVREEPDAVGVFPSLRAVSVCARRMMGVAYGYAVGVEGRVGAFRRGEVDLSVRHEDCEVSLRL